METKATEPTLKFSEINKILEEIFLGGTKYISNIETFKTKEFDYEEGNQGDYDETVQIKSLNNYPGYFVKITRRTDSYGDNEFIYKVEIVVSKPKTITEYLPIK